MKSAFQLIAERITAALVAAPALADGRVFLKRLRPLPVGVRTAIVVRWENAAAQEYVIGAHDWSTSYVVECYSRADTATDPDNLAADALLLDVWQRLFALDAQALDVTSLVVNPAISWDRVESDAPIECVFIHLRVEHRTPVQTLGS